MENIRVPAGSVVVGVDGSAGGAKALAWATQQAVLEHRTLVLVHSPGSGRTGWMDQPEVNPGQVIEAMRSHGRGVLDEAQGIVARTAPDLTVHTVLELMDPRVLLIDLSREATMVVVGSRGRGPLESVLLGSVSVSVARDASCPVVILRPEHDAGPRGGVLVGVDATGRSRAAVEFAFLQCSLRSLPLTALYCFWDVLPPGTGPGEVAVAEAGLDEQWLVLSEAVSGMSEKYPDVDVELRLARGPAEDWLVRASRTMDLVVVGAHEPQLLQGFFADHVDRELVEHGSCVVAVVPEGHRPDHAGATRSV